MEEDTTTVEHQEHLLKTVQNSSIEYPDGIDVPPETADNLTESVEILPHDIALHPEEIDLPSKGIAPTEDTEEHHEDIDICSTELKTDAKQIESPDYEPIQNSPTRDNQETDSIINVEEMEVDGLDKDERAEKNNQNVTKSQQTETVNPGIVEDCAITVDDSQDKKEGKTYFLFNIRK